MLIPVISIFDAVGLNASDYQKLLHKYGFDLHTTFYRKDLLSNSNLMEMYSELSQAIEKNHCQNLKILKNTSKKRT